MCVSTYDGINCFIAIFSLLCLVILTGCFGSVHSGLMHCIILWNSERGCSISHLAASSQISHPTAVSECVSVIRDNFWIIRARLMTAMLTEMTSFFLN